MSKYDPSWDEVMKMRGTRNMKNGGKGIGKHG